MDKLTLERIVKVGNRIEYIYSAEGVWERVFRKDSSFFLEYSFDVSVCPDSIAVIPFLGNMLPIAWIYNAEIVVDEIDKDYFENIEEIKRGYAWMFTDVQFLGGISVKKVIQNDIDTRENKCALFYSGGVDANSSLASVIKNKPTLITIWGTDIPLKDSIGWAKVSNLTVEAAKELSLDCVYIKTAFREILNYQFLNSKYYKRYDWWHEFQHAIALIAHSAPVAYLRKLRTVYFSSTDSVKSDVKYICASHPAMDNNSRFCGCRAIHEGFENTRQDKIRKTCRFITENNMDIKFHVCWVTTDGDNCCKCEKCARTIFGVLAEGYEPNDFGFKMDNNKYKDILEEIVNGKIIMYPTMWDGIIRKIASNKELLARMPEVNSIVKKYIKDNAIKDKISYIPTVTNVDRVLRDVANKEKEREAKIVLFRKPFVTDSVKSMYASWDNNTGNQIFTESIIKNIRPKVLSWDEYRAEPFSLDAVISTDLIWIHEKSDFDYISRMAETLKVPIVPISVGIQTKVGNKDFKLNKSVQYALELLQERATLGVRGENTAYILEKHGIKNINIIGCPSIYYNGEYGYELKNDIDNIKNVVSNFKSLGSYVEKNEKNFLSYCATRNYSFVEQTAHNFNLAACNYDEAYYKYVSPWYDANKNVFFNVAAWKNFIRTFDFSIGARFHGNVVALWENVPALFLTVDARTQEMVDYFKLPHINIEEFDWDKPIGYYYSLADYSEFNKGYQNKYENYVAFLKKNGIEIK